MEQTLDELFSFCRRDDYRASVRVCGGFGPRGLDTRGVGRAFCAAKSTALSWRSDALKTCAVLLGAINWGSLVEVHNPFEALNLQ